MPSDLLVLRPVLDALARLPDSALGRYYFQVPGDCLASPRAEPGRMMTRPDLRQ
jgi:hypothetical protein